MGAQKEGKEVTNIRLINNDIRQPPFCAIPEITYKGDPSRALSMIPTKVLMIQDVRYCYTCKVGEVCDLEIRENYQKLRENEILKEENTILE